MREDGEILWPAPAVELSPIRGLALWSSIFAHGLLIALLFSITFPETVRRVRYQAMPLFSPRPERRAAVRSLPPPHHVRPFIMRSPAQLLAPASKPQPATTVLAAPVSVIALPEAPRQLPPAPAIEPPRAIPPAGPVFAAGSYQAPAAARKAQLQIAAAGFAGPGGDAPAPVHTPSGVATGVFGDGVRTGGPAGPRAVQATGTFDSIGAATGQPLTASKVSSAHFESVSAMPATTSVKAGTGGGAHRLLEIFEKPRPAYSEEARRLHLEGEVVLEAMFSASGRIQVTRVIHGLGHGLDENAIAAASNIRFRPAIENGIPVDTVAVVRIAFQLAY